MAGDCRLRKRVWRLQISGTLDGKTTVLHIFSRHSLPNRKKVRRSLASSFFFLVVRRHVTGGSSYLSFDPISTGSFLIFIAVDNTLVASEGNLGVLVHFTFPLMVTETRQWRSSSSSPEYKVQTMLCEGNSRRCECGIMN